MRRSLPGRYVASLLQAVRACNMRFRPEQGLQEKERPRVYELHGCCKQCDRPLAVPVGWGPAGHLDRCKYALLFNQPVLLTLFYSGHSLQHCYSLQGDGGAGSCAAEWQG